MNKTKTNKTQLKENKMIDYDLIIDDKEIAYLQNCDFSNLLNDCDNLCQLIDSLNIEDEEIVFD